ncbi:hypothetical protein A9R05_05330 [Burkholderia sp. KK1]|nr:hypothetical protein A9R05_05330 [Burkholderia sp. KK1]
MSLVQRQRKSRLTRCLDAATTMRNEMTDAEILRLWIALVSADIDDEPVINFARALLEASTASDKQEAVMSREDWKELYNIAYDHDSFERFIETAKLNLAAPPAKSAESDNQAPVIGAHLWMPAEIAEPAGAPPDFGSRKSYAFKAPDAGEHDPWYVVLPNMCALKLGYHADDSIDRQHAEFIAAAINRALAKSAESAERRAEYWKAEHLAANEEIKRLQALLDKSAERTALNLQDVFNELREDFNLKDSGKALKAVERALDKSAESGKEEAAMVRAGIACLQRYAFRPNTRMNSLDKDGEGSWLRYSDVVRVVESSIKKDSK